MTVILQAAASFFHPGRFSQNVPDEDHPHFPGLLVEQFPFAIGAHIPVEDIDIHLRVHGLQLDGLLHGMGAAHLVAIRPLRDPGADALDERHRLGLLSRSRFLGDLHIHVQGQQDIGVLFVEVFTFRPVGYGADGDDHDAVLNRLAGGEG